MPVRSEERPEPSPISTVNFHFPTIEVHGTPARWISHSQLVDMASHQNDDNSADEATSSLGDSAYDFVDDRSVVTTDDESQDGLGGSVASSDVRDTDPNDAAFDYVLSPGREQADAHTGRSTTPQMPFEPQSPQIPVFPVGSHGLDMQYLPRETEETIVFEEQSNDDPNSSQHHAVCHTLMSSKSPGEAPIYPHGPIEDLSIRQMMTAQFLRLRNRSFKMIYVGDSTFKDIILQKIASALAVSDKLAESKSPSHRASRFSVVPISSFGDESHPDVVLIDAGRVELEINECRHASSIETPKEHGTLQMMLEDDTPLRSMPKGSEFEIAEDWRCPDIAVFFIAEKETLQTKSTRRYARMFMSRHSIPSIVVTEVPQWNQASEAMNLDHWTPHVCLETQGNGTGRSCVQKRFPIDLNTFLKIDAAHMNRNLASLTGKAHDIVGNEDTRQSAKPHRRANDEESRFNQYVKGHLELDKNDHGFTHRILDVRVAWTVVVLFLISFGFVKLLGYPGSRFSGTAGQRINLASVPVAFSTKSSPISPTPSSSVFSPLGSVTAAPAVLPPTKSLSTNTDIASFLLDQSKQAPNQSEKFKVHVLGDSHIVMRPPYWFTRSRKNPPLYFQVSRKDSVIDSEILTLFDGVYALQIPREEAYGLLKAVVWTQSKPIVKETLEVDFGSSWLKLVAWKRASRALTGSAQAELNNMQTILSTMYDKTKTGVSTFVQKNQVIHTWNQRFETAVLDCRKNWSTRMRNLQVAYSSNLPDHLAGLVQNRGRMAIEHMESLRQALSDQLICYSSSRMSRISQKASDARQAYAKSPFNSFARSAYGKGILHLRHTQKATLKSWWGLRGLPTKQYLRSRKEEGHRSSDRASRKVQL